MFEQGTDHVLISFLLLLGLQGLKSTNENGFCCIFQLCSGRGIGSPRWQLKPTDNPVEELEPNPVVQGIKLIMVNIMIFLLLVLFMCSCCVLTIQL